MSHPMEQMKLAHTICCEEIHCLSDNLNKFVSESRKIYHSIENAIDGPEGASILTDVRNNDNVLNLLTYDTYMTNVINVANLARKLNICLEGNDLSNLLRTNYRESGQLEAIAPFNKSQRSLQTFFSMETNLFENMNIEIKSSYRNAIIDAIESIQIFRKMQVAMNDLHLENSNEIKIAHRDLHEFQAGCEFKAIVSYFPYKNSLTFYSSLFTKLDIIKFKGNERVKAIERPLAEGQVFGIVCGSQDMLLRAVLISKELAMLIDLGDIMKIDSKNEFYCLPEEFANLPALAIKCVLIGVDEPDKLKDSDFTYMLNILKKYYMKEALFKVIRQLNRVLHVRLYDADHLKENKMKGYNTAADTDDDDGIYPIDVKENEIYNVFVTHIEGLNFYGHIAVDNCLRKTKIVWLDEEVPLSQKLIDEPKIKDLILARFENDKKWYRAIVEEVNLSENLYKVFYVDYGNRESLPLSALAKCHLSQFKEPFRAFLFVIDGLLDITVGDEDYQQKATEKLYCLLDETIEVFVFKNNENCCSICITDKRFKNIPQTLINEGYAVYNKICCNSEA